MLIQPMGHELRRNLETLGRSLGGGYKADDKAIDTAIRYVKRSILGWHPARRTLTKDEAVRRLERAGVINAVEDVNGFLEAISRQGNLEYGVCDNFSVEERNNRLGERVYHFAAWAT